MKHFYKAVVIPYEKYKRINEEVREVKDSDPELTLNKNEGEGEQINSESSGKDNILESDRIHNSTFSEKPSLSEERQNKNKSELEEITPPPPGIRNSKMKKDKNKKPLLKKSKKDLIKKIGLVFKNETVGTIFT